jgi:hypothetical protein
MRLAGILALADIDRGRFDVLRQLDQLPFYSGPQNAAARTHRRFTIAEAFALRLMRDLLADGAADLAGVPPSYAHRVIPNALARARDCGFRTLGDFATGRVLIGAAIFERRGDHRTERSRFAVAVARPQEELSRTLEPPVDGTRLVRLLLVDAGGAAGEVMERAESMGLCPSGSAHEVAV